MSDFIASIPEAWKNKLIFFLVGIVMGLGTGGWSGLFRADPFTGTQGGELSTRIDANAQRNIKLENWAESMSRKLNKLEARQEQCTELISKLPPKWLRDEVKECQREITELKALNRSIFRDHDRFFEWMGMGRHAE